MKLYAISGLGVDSRLFKHLELDIELIPLEWIRPNIGESLETYALRLAKRIDVNEPFGILGVSFGGLVAMEISKALHPAFTILISSAETKHELRSVYRYIGALGFVKWIPVPWFKIPKFPAGYIFGTSNKALLYPILDDTDPYFAKWAIQALITWKNTTRLSSILKISGGNDKLLPSGNHKNTTQIPNEGHFIIADRAKDVSQHINTYISSFCN